MRAGWIVGAALMVSVASSAAGCGPDSSTSGPSEQPADSVSTEVALSTAPSTTWESARPTAIGAPAPTTVSTVLGDDGSLAWTEPELLGSIDSIGMGAVGQGRKLVHFERTGQTFEGCEGATDPAYRLVMTDFDSGRRHVLIPELTRYDQSIELGPHDRFAILAGCDANAWLAAVGTLTPDGTIKIKRLEDAPDQRQVRGNNNAGTSMTWSPDGQILYFDTYRVDAATGDLLDVWAPDEPVRLHAELVDGSRLVSHRGQTDLSNSFWLLGPGEALETMPDRPPLFRGEAMYPAAQVEVSADGGGVAVALGWWGSEERTLLVRPGSVTELDGAVTLTSDWSRALVRTRDQDDEATLWTVVDLGSGAATTIPIESVPGIVHEVAWAGNETGLLISASPEELQQDTSLQIWYTEPAR